MKENKYFIEFKKILDKREERRQQRSELMKRRKKIKKSDCLVSQDTHCNVEDICLRNPLYN